MSKTVKARLYGTTNVMGIIKDFEVVDEIPNVSSIWEYNEDKRYYWKHIEPARLDPEQRFKGEDEINYYDFYTAELCDRETGNIQIRFYAIPKALEE